MKKAGAESAEPNQKKKHWLNSIHSKHLWSTYYVYVESRGESAHIPDMT